MKHKSTAAFLALVGGMIGLHKFYLNDKGSGIFYAFLSMITWDLFFLPIGAMLGVIDAIRLFSMSTAQFDAKYNKNSTRKRRHSTTGNVRTNQAARGSRGSRDATLQREQYKYNRDTRSNRSNPFRKSADQKFKDYDLEAALDDYKKSEEISKPDKQMYFNMACIYSLLEKPDLSLIHLEKAMDLGYKDVEKIKTADELAYLRIQPEYQAFIDNGYKVMTKTKAVEPPKDDLLQDDVLLSQLNKLKELRNRGLLSEKEYSYEKEKLRRR